MNGGVLADVGATHGTIDLLYDRHQGRQLEKKNTRNVNITRISRSLTQGDDATCWNAVCVAARVGPYLSLPERVEKDMDTRMATETQ